MQLVAQKYAKSMPPARIRLLSDRFLVGYTVKMKAINEYPYEIRILADEMLKIGLANLANGESVLWDFNDDPSPAPPREKSGEEPLGMQSHKEMEAWRWLKANGAIDWRWRTPDDPMDAAFIFTMKDTDKFSRLEDEVYEALAAEQDELNRQRADEEYARFIAEPLLISYDKEIGAGKYYETEFTVMGTNKKFFDALVDTAGQRPLDRKNVLKLLGITSGIPHAETVEINEHVKRLRRATGINHHIIQKSGSVGLHANVILESRFFKQKKPKSDPKSTN